MKKIIFLFLLLAATVSKAQITTVLIQPDTIGDAGQYIVNGLNIEQRAFNIISDSVVTFDCHLIIVTANGTADLPYNAGYFNVTVNITRSQTVNQTLVACRTAILNKPNPHLVLR